MRPFSRLLLPAVLAAVLTSAATAGDTGSWAPNLLPAENGGRSTILAAGAGSVVRSAALSGEKRKADSVDAGDAELLRPIGVGSVGGFGGLAAVESDPKLNVIYVESGFFAEFREAP